MVLDKSVEVEIRAVLLDSSMPKLSGAETIEGLSSLLEDRGRRHREDYYRSGILDSWYSTSHTLSMKTAISIPDELFHSADEAAKNLGLSRSALIQKALEDFLETKNQKAIIEKLNRVYSRVDSSVPLEIQKYQRSQIQAEEW